MIHGVRANGGTVFCYAPRSVLGAGEAVGCGLRLVVSGLGGVVVLQYASRHPPAGADRKTVAFRPRPDVAAGLPPGRKISSIQSVHPSREPGTITAMILFTSCNGADHTPIPRTNCGAALEGTARQPEIQ